MISADATQLTLVYVASFIRETDHEGFPVVAANNLLVGYVTRDQLREAIGTWTVRFLPRTCV